MIYRYDGSMSMPIAGDKILARETHVRQVGSGSQRSEMAVDGSIMTLVARTTAGGSSIVSQVSRRMCSTECRPLW